MKILTGKVISKKMKDTSVVVVERTIVHPIYRKRVKKTKKYHVHDTLETKIGQIVNFVACRPISKTKKWIIVGENTAGKNTKVVKKLAKPGKSRNLKGKK